MGGLAHYLESEGIPTAGISLIRAHTERIRPPRALAVPFELGRPFGPPNRPDLQRRVLAALLATFEDKSGPPVLVDFPDEGIEEEADQEGWACPVSFAAPVDEMSDADVIYRALGQEIALLRPWYDEAVKAYRRSAFGISGKTPEEIARVLADIVTDPEGAPAPVDGVNKAVGFKRCADDIRYFYTEAAIARPDQRTSDVEVANWLWGETTLGKVLIAIRDWAMDTEEGPFKTLAATGMVPNHQRWRTKHG